jgi:DNA-binding XRE family transcriptional regulator
MGHKVPRIVFKGMDMTPKSKFRNGFPLAIGDALVHIGERVRLARTRRGITQAEMAARMFVTRKTLSRLEKGELGVSLAVLGSALWVLGLESGLQEIANPESDAVGLHRERQRDPRRVRRATRDDTLDF